MTYSVEGRSTASDASEWVCNFWNPSSQRIVIWEFGIYFDPGVAGRLGTRRTTVRGTAGVTITPDIDNAWGMDDPPPSGMLLDLANFTVQPTPVTSLIHAWQYNGPAGLGNAINFPKGIVVPGGTGLGMKAETVTAWPISTVYVVWDEGT